MAVLSPRGAPRLALALLMLLLLASCGRDAQVGARADESTDDAGLAPLDDRFDGAWGGVLPCVDCDGIEVTLELQREAGAVGRYRLVETYLGATDAQDFETGGEWREEACRRGDERGRCIELVDAGQRWFRHADGTLQSVDADGRPLDPDGARLLRR